MTPPPPASDDVKAATLAAAIALSLPALAHGNAGRVEFTSGDVVGVASDGSERPLRKGSVVRDGDLIRTARGRAQVRFSDGAYVSLKPRTELRVDRYLFERDRPQQQSGLFSLLRGGARWISGLIGRAGGDRYQLRTPVATIGIRGTHFEAEVVGSDAGPDVMVSNWPGFHAGIVALFRELTGDALAVLPPGTVVRIGADGSVTFILGGGEVLAFDEGTVADALEGLADDLGEFASQWEQLEDGSYRGFDPESIEAPVIVVPTT